MGHKGSSNVRLISILGKVAANIMNDYMVS